MHEIIIGIDSLITFSHSFGGTLQMIPAELYPEHLKAMMMVDTFPSWKARGNWKLP